MAADHYRLPRPVEPSPGVELGATRPSTAEAVRAFVHSRQSTRWFELLAMLGLGLFAIAVRLPHLWTVPDLAEDAGQLFPALAIYQGAPWLGTASAAPNVATIFDVAFAGAFAIVGPSLYLPRLIALAQAVATVPLVYALTRELCRPLGRRRLDDAFLIPRLAGLVAAGLLATSVAHTIISSHLAGPAGFTPLVVLAALFAVERALGTRDGRWLVPGGALFGLAIQTHPSALALLPGVALVLWWRGRGVFAAHWVILGLLALVGTCAGLLIQLGVSPFGMEQIGRGLGALRSGPYPTGAAYVDALGATLVSLWRLLASQLAPLPALDDLVHDPLAWPYLILAALGSIVLIPRGRPLLPIAGLSSLLIVPYFAAPYDPSVGDRYLMPAVVIGIVASGVAVGLLAPIVTGRGSIPRLALGVMLGGLVLAPLGGLRSYYDQVSADEQRGDGLLIALTAVFDERRYNQVVLLDENLVRLRLRAGGHALEALRYLFAVSGVPTRTIRTSSDALAAETIGGRALVILERGSVRAAGAGAQLDPLLDDWIVPSANSNGAVMVYRAERLPTAYTWATWEPLVDDDDDEATGAEAP